jgi:mycothiol synthase
MTRLEVKRRLDDADLAAVRRLVGSAERADGHAPLGDRRWVDAAPGGGPREAFAAVLSRSAHDDDGGGDLVGYAQVARGDHDGRGWSVEVVTVAEGRPEKHVLVVGLLRRALDVVAGAGGGPVRWWVYRSDDGDHEAAHEVGLDESRDLWQMRRPLPLAEPFDVETRPFVPGRDEDAWLDVNNRAFSWHPEQGGWTRETLLAREAEPWFDPDGFLLHERDGRLAGFCWTKVHQADGLGEIYVIAVDPDVAGRGLGRQLVLAGLDSLHRRGVAVGMLYVDATNERAVRLYDDLGFTVDHVDRAFAGVVAPSGSEA